MKKFFKRLFCTVLCLALAFVLVRFGPNIYYRLFGAQHATWLSERFTESLREKNELVVYEVEVTGQETVAQDAMLIGTIQKIELPYTFSMNFTVDLSRAKVSANDQIIEVRVPSPRPGYQKLTVDEGNVKKYDWLYPITTERYAEICTTVENKLFDEYSVNETCTQQAWQTAVRNLETLLGGVADSAGYSNMFEIRIIQDDTLQAPDAADQSAV